MSAEQTRFDWNATESAPEHYPMEIISGSLEYSGGGVSVPSGAYLDNGWGLGRTTIASGPSQRPVPEKLDILFYSYLEDTFYEGRFELPHDKILAYFQQQEAQPKQKYRSGQEMPVSYEFVVGVAPGGTVAVWARANGSKEVFFGQATKRNDVNFSKAMGGVPIADQADRTDFVNDILKDSLASEVLTSIRKHGIPFKKWSQYRAQYSWLPEFVINAPLKKFNMSFFNGEGARYIYPLEKNVVTSTHPVPDSIKFAYTPKDSDTEYLYYIHFDEKEMFDVFAKLAGKQLPMQLEVHPILPIQKTQIRLKNKDEAIVLKKFMIEKID